MNEPKLVPLHANPRNHQKLSFNGGPDIIRDSSSRNTLVFDKLVWSVEDVAKELSVSIRHVRRLVSSDKIPYAKIGSCVRFSPAKISEWLLKGGTR
jgi:excisionase family DNA binding protein